MGKVFIITGPSGVGKTTIAEIVRTRASALADRTGCECNLGRVVTTTTRPSRPGEVDGVDYNFVSTPVFKSMQVNNEFVEFANVYGNMYGTTHDGLANARVNQHALHVCDVQGARTLSNSVDVVTIFIACSSPATLADRMVNRNDVELRLTTAKQELAAAGEFEYIVVNDDLATAVTQVEQIISSYGK